MPHTKNCLNCGKIITGKITKLFCDDACRKYYRRHGGTGLSGISTGNFIPACPDKSGQRRTLSPAKSNKMEDYFIKKLIDVGANTLQSHLTPTPIEQKNKATETGQKNLPLKTQSADVDPLKLYTHEYIKLSDEFKGFLGNISYPFKMLVWGEPGQGKSTFCMKLADQIASYWDILYVSGEEALDSATLMDKQRRVIQPDNRKKCIFINRLPNTEKEWKETITEKEDNKTLILFKTIFYDSVTKLNITPFYADATANDCKMAFFNEKIAHIFISHAHKDGSTYRGDGSWGHEVDVIIRCENGVAIVEKNRFATATKGKTGSVLKIY